MNQAYEISHLLAGAMLVTSFALLYQERIAAVLNAFAAQSITLALAVAWAAWSQDRPDLFITALIALTLKGIIIPVALHRTVARLGIHREVEKVVGVGVALMVGLALTGLAQALVLKVAQGSASHAREELALALAIILLGFLMMIVRRNAVTQVVGFMSMENGLILAATGARGMPLVVEVSVAFSVLIALFVFAVFVFRIRERFDTVDHRGARPHARGPPMIHAYQLVVLAPYAAALVLVAIPGYRVGAVVNVLASAATFAAGLWLLIGGERERRRLRHRRRVQHRLHRHQHPGRLHHRAVQRLLHRPRDRDRPAAAELRAILPRHVPGHDGLDERRPASPTISA